MANRQKISDLGGLALAMPAISILFLLMLVPIGIAFIYSFLSPNIYGGVVLPWSLESYLRFFFERDFDGTLLFTAAYIGIFSRSLIFAAITTAICIVLGFPLAWFIATRTANVRALLILVISVPFWTSLLIRTYSWVLLLRNEGPINGSLIELGVLKHPVTFLYTDGAVILGLVYAALPFMVLPIFSVLERVDRRLIEAAFDLYSTRWDIALQIVLPLAKPGIISGCVLVFVPSLGAFLQPDILGGGKKLMIGSLIQQQFTTSRDWAFGSALSMILMAIVLGALIASNMRKTLKVAGTEAVA